MPTDLGDGQRADRMGRQRTSSMMDPLDSDGSLSEAIISDNSDTSSSTSSSDESAPSKITVNKRKRQTAGKGENGAYKRKKAANKKETQKGPGGKGRGAVGTTKRARSSTGSALQRKKANKGGSKLYCICRSEYDGEEFMIACDSCQEWFHGRCVGVKQSRSSEKEYHCANCRQRQAGKGQKGKGAKKGNGSKSAAIASALVEEEETVDDDICVLCEGDCTCNSVGATTANKSNRNSETASITGARKNSVTALQSTGDDVSPASKVQTNTKAKNARSSLKEGNSKAKKKDGKERKGSIAERKASISGVDLADDMGSNGTILEITITETLTLEDSDTLSLLDSDISNDEDSSHDEAHDDDNLAVESESEDDMSVGDANQRILGWSESEEDEDEEDEEDIFQSPEMAPSQDSGDELKLTLDLDPDLQELLNMGLSADALDDICLDFVNAEVGIADLDFLDAPSVAGSDTTSINENVIVIADSNQDGANPVTPLLNTLPSTSSPLVLTPAAVTASDAAAAALQAANSTAPPTSSSAPASAAPTSISFDIKKTDVGPNGEITTTTKTMTFQLNGAQSANLAAGKAIGTKRKGGQAAIPKRGTRGGPRLGPTISSLGGGSALLQPLHARSATGAGGSSVASSMSPFSSFLTSAASNAATLALANNYNASLASSNSAYALPTSSSLAASSGAAAATQSALAAANFFKTTPLDPSILAAAAAAMVNSGTLFSGTLPAGNPPTPIARPELQKFIDSVTLNARVKAAQAALAAAVNGSSSPATQPSSLSSGAPIPSLFTKGQDGNLKFKINRPGELSSTAGTSNIHPTTSNPPPTNPFLGFEFPKTMEELTRMFSPQHVAAAAAAAAAYSNNVNNAKASTSTAGKSTISGPNILSGMSSTTANSPHMFSSSGFSGVPSPNVLTQAVLGAGVGAVSADHSVKTAHTPHSLMTTAPILVSSPPPVLLPPGAVPPPSSTSSSSSSPSSSTVPTQSIPQASIPPPVPSMTLDDFFDTAALNSQIADTPPSPSRTNGKPDATERWRTIPIGAFRRSRRRSGDITGWRILKSAIKGGERRVFNETLLKDCRVPQSHEPSLGAGAAANAAVSNHNGHRPTTTADDEAEHTNHPPNMERMDSLFEEEWGGAWSVLDQTSHQDHLPPSSSSSTTQPRSVFDIPPTPAQLSSTTSSTSSTSSKSKKSKNRKRLSYR
ncbi:hypothetical protein DFS34DRAFT_419031 [Phlyctochytrium arcticum]|nr:hypothetical protein DFS34DRAFT_419031 [Phlyctochytrium arcticum]